MSASQNIENWLPGIEENGLNTLKTVDFSGSPVALLPVIVGTRQLIDESAPGATTVISLDTLITEITAISAPSYSLADGVPGQVKIVISVSGSFYIVPTTPSGFTQVQVNATGGGAMLFFTSAGWAPISINGAYII